MSNAVLPNGVFCRRCAGFRRPPRPSIVAHVPQGTLRSSFGPIRLVGIHARCFGLEPPHFYFSRIRCPDLQFRSSRKNFKKRGLRCGEDICIVFACRLGITQTARETWWVWPSWLGRKIVALEVVGSNPITHPSFSTQGIVGYESYVHNDCGKPRTFTYAFFSGSLA